MELPKEIESYGAAALQIVAWMPNWISQDEFDWLARDRAPLNRAWFMDEHTIVLGEPNGLNKELDLLHRLVACGVVEYKRGDNGLIYYRDRYKNLGKP